MIYNKGINDMPKGWMSKNNKNKRIYKTWHHMLVRCYDEKYHETRPTYIGCSVCNDWLILSNFVRDFKLIDGYDEEKFLNGELCLDKDIKSDGKNKIYCLEQCMFVSKEENIRQSNKTMDYSFMKERIGENHPMWNKGVKIAQYDKNSNLIKIWNGSRDIQRELNINQGSIIACCQWYACGEDKKEWFKTHKNYPYKSVGGFIWKYYKENNKN